RRQGAVRHGRSGGDRDHLRRDRRDSRLVGGALQRARDQGCWRALCEGRGRQMRPLLACAGRSESPHPSLRPLHRGGCCHACQSARMKLEPREVGLIAAAVSLVADQGSKLFLLYGAHFVHMLPGSSVPVLPFFNLVMVWNPGISYGLFPASSAYGTVALVGISIVAVAGLTWWLWGSTSRVLTAGFGLIIGGA